MKQEVQWYLVEQLSKARAMADSADRAQRRREVLGRFGATLQAFRYLEALSEGEARDWNDRMLVALGLTPPPPSGHGMPRMIWVGDGPPPAPTRPSAPHFVRQVLGPDGEFEQSGGSLRVLAIEIYDTMTAVRWRVAPEPDMSTMFPTEWDALQQDVDGLDDWAAEHLRQKAERELRMMRAYQFDLADDLETAYRFSGGGSGGGSGEMTGRATFEPAPPPSATRLVLGWHNVTAEIPIV
jgi:hypothetical protein